ncbi:MAG: hydroxymethylbilane synthase [Steroidobacteraceae bacterium]
MTGNVLRIGTRASALALWQARHVEALIGALPDAPAVELVPIVTTGDLQTQVPLWAVRGRAFFTKELDRALLDERIDLAVHSLKDLTTELELGLALAAVLEREDPLDALVSQQGTPLAALEAGARVGTSSLRRRAFLARARPDLHLLELRGNVPTRIERLERGEYDAIVLAAAGLKRLGLEARISERLAPEDFPPAVSQGAIGICTREHDAKTRSWVSRLEHGPTRLAATAERALLRRIEGGCQVPLGALATLAGTELSLRAVVCALDGRTSLTASGTASAGADEARALGERLAETLIAQGASRLIATQRAAQKDANA